MRPFRAAMRSPAGIPTIGMVPRIVAVVEPTRPEAMPTGDNARIPKRQGTMGNQPLASTAAFRPASRTVSWTSLGERRRAPSQPRLRRLSHMDHPPLSEDELEFLDDLLLEHGGDHAVLGISELDGLLTAIASAPDVVPPSLWLDAIWGGPEDAPDWKDQQTFERFIELVFRHQNSIVARLMVGGPLEPLLMENVQDGRPLLVAEEWCCGYMLGVALGQWPELPPSLAPELEAIALHGTDAGFDLLDELSVDEHQATINAIEPAALALHAHWLQQRSPAAPTRRAPSKVGRNAPCPCGSGRQYKQCCLH